MLKQPSFKVVFCALLALASLLPNGRGAKCGANNPTVRQTQLGFGNPPKFMVEVQNNCQMCPAIDIHVKCGSFSQALVNPRIFKVLGYNDCVVNGGLPLAPMQKISFNYSHHKFLMSTSTWYFQCE
ncbi:hypothetical protein HHK36_013203 [Tetracentron sinense]|uniref:Uncharacterized protein n=1 Tax=Tetracentron sinense TaxID=13715 RepID=A0A834ZAB9_TETSI|nr:hypothetical protein HHK36_013203 [Tetracentron sinense]